MDDNQARRDDMALRLFGHARFRDRRLRYLEEQIVTVELKLADLEEKLKDPSLSDKERHLLWEDVLATFRQWTTLSNKRADLGFLLKGFKPLGPLQG